MRNHIIPPAPIAEGIRTGKVTMWAELVKPQPNPPRAIYDIDDCIITVGTKENGGYGSYMIGWRKEFNYPNKALIRDGGLWMDLPLPLNSKIAVKETIVSNALGGAIYKSGGKVTCGMELEENEYIDIDYVDKTYRGFIPSSSLPLKYVRTFIEFESVEVRRVNDLWLPTYEEMEQEYFKFGVAKYPLSKPCGVNNTNHVYDWQDRRGLSDAELLNKCLMSARGTYGNYIAHRFGSDFYDSNGYLFIYKRKAI